MVGTCSIHRGDKKCMKEKVRLENLGQECKNPRSQVAQATTLSQVKPKICDSPVCNLVYATLLAPAIWTLKCPLSAELDPY
jgi:hypothetical protein